MSNIIHISNVLPPRKKKVMFYPKLLIFSYLYCTWFFHKLHHIYKLFLPSPLAAVMAAATNRILHVVHVCYFSPHSWMGLTCMAISPPWWAFRGGWIGVLGRISGTPTLLGAPGAPMPKNIFKMFEKFWKKLAQSYNINVSCHKISNQNSKHCSRYKNDKFDINVIMGQI